MENTNANFLGDSIIEKEDSKFCKLFLDGIMDIYWVEKELIDMLPYMKEGATSRKLKEIISAHLQETVGHASRLEDIFALMNIESNTKKCKAMAALIKEVKELLSDTGEDSMVRDSAIIFAAQKIEHYEISTYGTLYRWGQLMGRLDIADLLHKNLDEEKAADDALANTVESIIRNQGTKE